MQKSLFRSRGKKIRSTHAYAHACALAVLGLLGSGCLTPGQDAIKRAASNPQSATVAPAIPEGAKAVKIIFRQASPTGSFNAPITGGTVNAVGSGLPAVRVFNANGTLLSDDSNATTWPKWLGRVEIGISGNNNLAATNPDCVRFASTLDEIAVCDFDQNAGTAGKLCGASAGLLRVSEVNCVAPGSSITNGIGGPSDGVYIRAEFNRNAKYLGEQENILAVLEYSSSVLHPAPSDPTKCFTNGVFDPTNPLCSDMSWQIFMKHTAAEIVQPFLLLVPPAFHSVDTANNRAGAGVGTKQFIIPLASDAGLQVMQISRIRAMASTAELTTVCSDNSAFCMGMVFHSLTFFRI
ncbi:MAG: hypothetical protein AB7P04_06280 [Bacteriovoracia bacterium]